MILDALQQFDPAGTSVAIAQGTQPSTNVLDYGILAGIPSAANGGGARDMGIGDKPALKLMVEVVDEAFTSAGGTGTIQVAVQYAPDDGTGQPGAFVTAATGPSFVVPGIGTRLLDIDLPRPKAGLVPRYCRLLYTIGTQDALTGKVAAYVVLDRDDQPSQAAGVYGGYQPGIAVAN